MKIYEEIKLDIVLLYSEDIITTSPPDNGFNPKDEDEDDNWGW